MRARAARGDVRILQIGNYPPPRCGWSVRTEMLVRELRRAGAECEVLNIGPSRRERLPGCVDVQDGPDFLVKILRFGLRRYRFHVHANGDSPKGFVLALSALIVGTLFGRRPVLTFHAGVSQRFFPRRELPASVLFRLLFGLPGAVICNSEPVRQAIQRYGTPDARIHVIPAFSSQYLADLERSATLPPRLESFAATRAPLLVCYAAFRPEFMLEQLFRVIARASLAHERLGLVLVGHLAGHERFVRQARELGIAERTYFAGDLSHAEFLAVLRRADVYVRTHLRDGVSSSVLEALALGTPVLAAENESRPPGVVTYTGGDEIDLARKLGAMLAEPARSSASFAGVEDTLAAEVALLLASGRRRAS